MARTGFDNRPRGRRWRKTLRRRGPWLDQCRSIASRCPCWQWCRYSASRRLCRRRAAIWADQKKYLRGEGEPKFDATEIAGAERSRDPFDRVAGERNTPSIKVANEKPSFNMTRAMSSPCTRLNALTIAVMCSGRVFMYLRSRSRKNYRVLVLTPESGDQTSRKSAAHCVSGISSEYGMADNTGRY